MLNNVSNFLGVCPDIAAAPKLAAFPYYDGQAKRVDHRVAPFSRRNLGGGPWHHVLILTVPDLDGLNPCSDFRHSPKILLGEVNHLQKYENWI